MVDNDAGKASTVPAYFLVKLKKGKRYHYVFCEMVASCNFPADPGDQCHGDEVPFLSQQALDDMFVNQARLAMRAGITDVEAAVLSEPGDACSTWTTFSARKQSGDAQSGDDEDPIP